MFFFVCGPHCCGKTTILETLDAEGLVDFRGAEIGKELYYERRFQPASQDRDFEVEVARKELERDGALAGREGVQGVETWHPGNLAYAAVRNPRCLDELIELAKRSPLLPFARGIRLRLSPREIARRTKTFSSDPWWAADFYSRIDARMEECLRRLGLRERTLVARADGPLEAVTERVRSWLRSQRGASGKRGAPGEETATGKRRDRPDSFAGDGVLV